MIGAGAYAAMLQSHAVSLLTSRAADHAAGAVSSRIAVHRGDTQRDQAVVVLVQVVRNELERVARSQRIWFLATCRQLQLGDGYAQRMLKGYPQLADLPTNTAAPLIFACNAREGTLQPRQECVIVPTVYITLAHGRIMVDVHLLDLPSPTAKRRIALIILTPAKWSNLSAAQAPESLIVPGFLTNGSALAAIQHPAERQKTVDHT
ncbi:hypothetical protein SVAN01_09404 [Stagonosporopsis vannaccii]|nr:hypothetical protein SVAN01_09404 [Stagonosporopsis vannaccii]